jgi:hypothetical protein
MQWKYLGFVKGEMHISMETAFYQPNLKWYYAAQINSSNVYCTNYM